MANDPDQTYIPADPEGPTETEETVDRLEEKVLGGRAPDGVEPPPEDGTEEPPD